MKRSSFLIEDLAISTKTIWASLVAQLVKNLPAMQETQVQFLGWKISQRRNWQPTPVFLRGESPGKGFWQATVHVFTRVRHDLATKPPSLPPKLFNFNILVPILGFSLKIHCQTHTHTHTNLHVQSSLLSIICNFKGL